MTRSRFRLKGARESAMSSNHAVPLQRLKRMKNSMRVMGFSGWKTYATFCHPCVPCSKSPRCPHRLVPSSYQQSM